MSTIASTIKETLSSTNYKTEGFNNFSEFYPFYLSQHRSTFNRKLHFISTILYISNLIYQLVFGRLIYIAFCPVLAYGPAWYGHYFYEKNKPATFLYPFYSLAGDFVMFFDILFGKIDGLFKKYNIKMKD